MAMIDSLPFIFQKLTEVQCLVKTLQDVVTDMYKSGMGLACQESVNCDPPIHTVDPNRIRTNITNIDLSSRNISMDVASLMNEYLNTSTVTNVESLLGSKFIDGTLSKAKESTNKADRKLMQ